MIWKMNKFRPNVSRFETDSKKEARKIKELLDEKHIGYCTCVTSTRHPLVPEQEWSVIFNIYSCRGNADILKLMFEMEGS